MCSLVHQNHIGSNFRLAIEQAGSTCPHHLLYFDNIANLQFFIGENENYLRWASVLVKQKCSSYMHYWNFQEERHLLCNYHPAGQHVYHTKMHSWKMYPRSSILCQDIECRILHWPKFHRIFKHYKPRLLKSSSTTAQYLVIWEGPNSGCTPV